MAPKLRLGVLAGCGISIYIISANFLLLYLGISEEINAADRRWPTSADALLSVVVAPLAEEFVFRFVPIRLMQKATESKRVLWAVVIVSSLIFALGHEHPAPIPVFGAVGVILSLVFLKGGYWTSVLSHATHNTLVLFVLNPFFLY